MVSVGTRDLEQARRLERGLIRVRWFGVALGTYLIFQTNSGSPPFASNLVLALSYCIIGALAVGNIAIWWASNHARSVSSMKRVGVAAFALDAAVLCSLAWVFSYDPRGNTWVIMYILPLIGALRWRLQGALASVAITLANEVGREIYLAHRFSHSVVVDGAHIDRYPFLIANVAFRVGIEAIIALVAGFMSRSLAKEAEKAAEQAYRFQELARRESAIRRQLAAFNTAILAGVAAEDLDSSLRLMAAAIGRDLGFETFSILLRDDQELVVKGMYGMPFYEDRIPFGQGVTGSVAVTGNPVAVPDVTSFPAYIVVDPEIRSEMAAPMRIGDELIGVVDVESRTPDAFDEDALALLTRLGDQIALVAHSNRLLSQQRETMTRLQELDQMKSDFVAITSHELRTPITAIRGFVKTLLRNRDRLSDDQLTNFMNIIDRQSGRLARLVEDLLFVSRIEAGTIRLQMETVDLGAFLHDTVEALGPEGRNRVRLRLSPPEATVVIDPQRMDQIVRNLVENALKFSQPETEVVIDASMRRGRLRLAVIDQGVGIAPEDLPNIFDRFHQAGHVLTRETEGAGLGLYITKRLTEAMGGTIRVTSTLGSGSTFVVNIPSAMAQEESPNGQAAARSDANASVRSGS
jgi:signal transduction histidine kinase